MYAELDMFVWVTNNIKTIQRKVLSVGAGVMRRANDLGARPNGVGPG